MQQFPLKARRDPGLFLLENQFEQTQVLRLRADPSTASIACDCDEASHVGHGSRREWLSGNHFLWGFDYRRSVFRSYYFYGAAPESMTVHLKALGAFPYARRNLRAGQSFEADDQDARILVTIGRAQYATRAMRAEVPVAPVAVLAVEAPKKRRGRPRKNKT